MNPSQVNYRLHLAAALPLLVGLSACATGSHRQNQTYASSGYEEHSVYPNTTGVQDYYIFYPQHDVYYDPRQKRYLTLENSKWVSRPTPRGVRIDQLHASPGVRLDTGSSPAHHHDNMVRRYPRNWTPDRSGFSNVEYRVHDRPLQRGRVYSPR